MFLWSLDQVDKVLLRCRYEYLAVPLLAVAHTAPVLQQPIEHRLPYECAAVVGRERIDVTNIDDSVSGRPHVNYQICYVTTTG